MYLKKSLWLFKIISEVCAMEMEDNRVRCKPGDFSLGKTQEMIVSLCKQGFTPEMAQKIIEEEETARMVVAVFANLGQPQRRLYPVTIDSSMSLEDIIKAGKYDWINDDTYTKNFSSQGGALGEVVIELLHFGRNISTKNALVEMDKQGFRPATVRELAALGAAYPDLQREFLVIALGSVWQNLYGDRGVAYLGRDGSRRKLGLYWGGDDWSDSCRFAVVRK